MKYKLRPAQKSEAATLAVLADMAGHGLPSWFWAPVRQSGHFVSIVEVGRDRILKDDHTLSYRRMTVAEAGDEVAGMLLDYAIDPPMDDAAISEEHAVVQPLLRLEAKAQGSWYINMLAVFREFRDAGIGKVLIEESARRALTAGKTEHSLIVEDDNPARDLYERCGFACRSQEAFVPFEGSMKRSGNWLLMTRAAG